MLFLLLLLIHIIHGQSIEILESGQIYSSSKSIGTLLYINLFNHLSVPIRISGVIEHCCTSIDHCIPLRLLGGDFGKWKSNKNRSMIFLWPGMHWEYINDESFCQVSLLFGKRNHMTHDIKINYIPIGSKKTIQKSLLNDDNPFELTNSPYNNFPKCNQFLNILTNHCENLDNLRRNFSFNFSSPFISFNHRYLPMKCIHGIQSKDCHCQENFITLPVNQKLYHSKSYIHQFCTHSVNYQYYNLFLLFIITSILFILYIIILIISSIFICTYYRQIEEEEGSVSKHEYNHKTIHESDLFTNQRFSVIEIASLD